MILLADGGILTKLACDSTDCLSYIISLFDIFTVLYLSYCASFRVNKGVRIFGWVWAAVVVVATVTVIAIHACLFTLVAAFFTALVLMALFGVTFESMVKEKKDKEPKAEEKEKPSEPMVCPLVKCGCMMMQAQSAPVASEQKSPAPEEAPAPAPAPVETAPEKTAPEETAPAQVEEVAATEAVAEPIQEDVAEEEIADEEPQEGVSLKESIELAKTMATHIDINKAYVAAYLGGKYGDDVVLNQRANATQKGLPIPDTHYVNGEKKVCFVYVYEIHGTTILLLKVDDKYGQALRKKHPIAKRSAFPKSRDFWYNVIIDDSFTAAEVEGILDDAYRMNGGKVAEEGVVLKDILATANATVTTVKLSKKGIADFLIGEFGEDVRTNCRGNYTKKKVPLPDTHYAVGKDGNKCFVYVYEIDTTVVLLLRLTEKYAESVRASGHKIMRSIFPKCRDPWYSIILDDSFSEADVQEILIDSYNIAK